MDFTIPDGHDERREAARVFARQVVGSSTAARDRASRWEPEIFTQMGAAGLLGGVIPKEYGGGGLDAVEWGAQQEGFGLGAEDAGLARAWGTHTLQCAVPIAQLGTETQR